MKWPALVPVVLMLSACTAFGPDRRPPQMPQPAHYSVEGQPAQTAEADGIAQQVTVGARPVPKWWTAYGSDDLDALVEEGLRNSPSLATAKSTLQVAREQLRSQIGDNFFPKVDLEFSPERQRALGIPVLPQQTFIENIFVAQAKASYSFDFFGAAFLADRSLAGQVQQQALQLEATRRALAANIVVATIDAASLQEQVSATEKLVALGEQRAQQTAARYKLGSASRDEMLASEQDAANAAATLPALRAQALAMRHAQAVLLGRTPDDAPAPLQLQALKLPQTVPVSVPSDLLHQRPDILAAESAVRAAADAAGAATASMFPSLSLTASYGHGGFDWSTFTSPQGVIWGVGASLTQPLFHGGALFARKRQYQASYDVAVGQYKQTVLSAFRTVADTLVSLDEDANTLFQTQRSEIAARDAQSNTESRYRLGATSFFVTLTAGQQYQNAHIQYVRARASRLADTAALFDAMGNPAGDQLL
ncbi:MAG: efflux system, outer rane lipoprotein NodT family [Gammaproteobacteria bacterium]|nr:efflux system, outer rane lipoprotein NodT family [Gammaproteobacteria bacterium]